jgi:site-specific DNA-methyltransferase (adenine-specific)
VSNAKLLKGDCLRLMADIEPGSVDMVMADLPYGTTQCAWDALIPFDELWNMIRQVTKPDAAIVLTADQPFTSALIMSNPREFRYCWTWVKDYSTGFLNANKMPLKNTEDVCVFYRQLPVYNPQGVKKHEITQHIKRGKVDGDYSDRGGGAYGRTGVAHSEYKMVNTNFPKQTLSFGKDDKQYHPTQKPVALMAYLIRTYTNPGDVVLDPCMGSGSTGVAATMTNRKFIGMELEPGHFTTAKERISDAARWTAPFTERKNERVRRVR